MSFSHQHEFCALTLFRLSHFKPPPLFCRRKGAITHCLRPVQQLLSIHHPDQCFPRLDQQPGFSPGLVATPTSRRRRDTCLVNPANGLRFSASKVCLRDMSERRLAGVRHPMNVRIFKEIPDDSPRGIRDKWLRSRRASCRIRSTSFRP